MSAFVLEMPEGLASVSIVVEMPTVMNEDTSEIHVLVHGRVEEPLGSAQIVDKLFLVEMHDGQEQDPTMRVYERKFDGVAFVGTTRGPR
jgi:heterodisulfide reductase subunit A-like polyferredoxin